MNFQPNDVPNHLKKKFLEGRLSPLKWAENFLIDPTLGTPFKAQYPQTFILNSEKLVTWICVHRRAGKCVTGDTLVIDPCTLRPTPISKAANFKKTLCFDLKSNQVVWTGCTWMESGLKKCLKLELSSGVNLSLSDDHPVFHWKKGWVNASELKIGDRILAPTAISIFGDTVPTESELQLEIDRTLADNRVPDIVFSYDRDNLKKFMAEFFLSTGRIHHQQQMVTFMLWNKALCKDLRHLLIRLGVDSRIDEDGNLFIDDIIDRSVFLNLIGFDYLVTEIKPARKWEIITGIKKTGNQPVYDLSVDHSDHNFIGNDIVLHNSYAMSIAALWHAIHNEGKAICVFAPSSTQINEFFGVIDKWINKNPFLQDLLSPVGNHKNPQLRSFETGSTIQGYLMGMSGALEAAKRGITADIMIIDEAQELDEEDWKVLGPIMVGDKERWGKVKTYIAGTINKPANHYYNKIYKLPMEEHEKKIFIPVTENKEYTDDDVLMLKSQVAPFQWTTEYLLKVAEGDDSVFRMEDIEAASQWDWQYGVDCIEHRKVRFIGVDWDKVQAGTNIAVFQYDTLTQVVQMIYHYEIPRERFTYTNACQTIIELYEAFQPELVIADQGQGEMQWEYLQLESQKRGIPLSERLIKLAFNQKVEVPNPQTAELEKKLVKPFLVGLMQEKLQERKFLFPSHHADFKDQLMSYKRKETTTLTIKFSSEKEHMIDCALFAIYGIWLLYENKLEGNYGKEHSTFRVFNDSKLPIGEEVEQLFWNQLEGPRLDIRGTQLPRTDFSTWGIQDNRTAMDFFIDQDKGYF